MKKIWCLPNQAHFQIKEVNDLGGINQIFKIWCSEFCCCYNKYFKLQSKNIKQCCMKWTLIETCFVGLVT